MRLTSNAKHLIFYLVAALVVLVAACFVREFTWANDYYYTAVFLQAVLLIASVPLFLGAIVYGYRIQNVRVDKMRPSWNRKHNKELDEIYGRGKNMPK
jgi:hypothetical protein